MTAVIVDTSAVLAIFDESYPEHEPIAAILESGPHLVVSPMIAAEADYMLTERLGAPAARIFAADVSAGAYDLAAWGSADHADALAVTDRLGTRDYAGLADASNVVLAGRYRTSLLMTLDHAQRRHGMGGCPRAAGGPGRPQRPGRLRSRPAPCGGLPPR